MLVGLLSHPFSLISGFSLKFLWNGIFLQNLSIFSDASHHFSDLIVSLLNLFIFSNNSLLSLFSVFSELSLVFWISPFSLNSGFSYISVFSDLLYSFSPEFLHFLLCLTSLLNLFSLICGISSRYLHFPWSLTYLLILFVFCDLWLLSSISQFTLISQASLLNFSIFYNLTSILNQFSLHSHFWL